MSIDFLVHFIISHMFPALQAPQLCKLFEESVVFVDTGLFQLPVGACWESVLCEIGQDEPELELEYRSALFSAYSI